MKKTRLRSEYASLDSDNSEQIWQARLELIGATKRVFPKFLRTLSKDVFPVYSRLSKDGELTKHGHPLKKVLRSDNVGDVLSNEIAEDLRVAVLKWAARFHAGADWLILGALRSLDRWYEFPDYHRLLAWDTLHERTELAWAGEPFEFRYLAWEVRMQSWPDYRSGLLRRFRQDLRSYEGRIRELATSQGLIAISKKVSAVNLEWFVLYQFAGQSSVKIASASTSMARPPDESTILKGVKAAAKRIGWNQLREPLSKTPPEN